MEFIDKHLDRIKNIFEKHNVIFAYLFGSQVSGCVGGLSDIDIAVYLDEKLNSSERFNKRLKLMADLSDLFNREDVDVVILNDAYPLLEHRIIRDGKIIFCADNQKRIDYEVKAVMRYLDFQPYIEKYTKETLYGRQR